MRRTPLRRPRRRSVDAERRSRWFTAILYPEVKGRRTKAKCAACGKPRNLLDPHHVLSKHFLKGVAGTLRLDPDDLLWDERNGLALCRWCHDGQHGAQAKLPVSVVPDEAWEFVKWIDSLLGTEAATVEIERRYG